MIKMSISSAKRLGFVINGYEFTDKKKTPQPIMKKKTQKKARIKKSEKTKQIPLEKVGGGRIMRLKIISKD